MVAAALLCGAAGLGVAVGAQAERSVGQGAGGQGAGRTAAATAVESVPIPHRVHVRSGPLARARSKLVEFDTAPFPYDGLMPRSNRPFLDVVENGRRGHRTGAG